MTKSKTNLITRNLENKIYFLRNHKVMIDVDLAKIYGVSVKRLNEQVRRNLKRFPEDFMMRLSYEENIFLRSQIATLEKGQGKHRKYLPNAFTEHGAVMLASILNSKIAVEASIRVVRAFVKLREVLSTHKELAEKIVKLERHLKTRVSKHDKEIKLLFQAIHQLMEPVNPPRKKIGFKRTKE